METECSIFITFGVAVVVVLVGIFGVNIFNSVKSEREAERLRKAKAKVKALNPQWSLEVLPTGTLQGKLSPASLESTFGQGRCYRDENAFLFLLNWGLNSFILKQVTSPDEGKVLITGTIGDFDEWVKKGCPLTPLQSRFP